MEISPLQLRKRKFRTREQILSNLKMANKRSRDNSEDMSRAIDDILNQEKSQSAPVYNDSYSTTQTEVGTPALHAHSPVNLATYFTCPLVIYNQCNPSEHPAVANSKTYLPSGEPSTNVNPNIAPTTPELNSTLATSAFISHNYTLQPVSTNLPISTPTSLLAQFPANLTTNLPQPLGFSDKHNSCEEEIIALLRSPANSEYMRRTMHQILDQGSSSSEPVHVGSYITMVDDFDTSALEAQPPVDLKTCFPHSPAFSLSDPDSGIDEEITTFLRFPDYSEDRAMDDILDQGSSSTEQFYIGSYPTMHADFDTSALQAQPPVNLATYFQHPLASSNQGNTSEQPAVVSELLKWNTQKLIRPLRLVSHSLRKNQIQSFQRSYAKALTLSKYIHHGTKI